MGPFFSLGDQEMKNKMISDGWTHLFQPHNKATPNPRHRFSMQILAIPKWPTPIHGTVKAELPLLCKASSTVHNTLALASYSFALHFWTQNTHRLLCITRRVKFSRHWLGTKFIVTIHYPVDKNDGLATLTSPFRITWQFSVMCSLLMKIHIYQKHLAKSKYTSSRNYNWLWRLNLEARHALKSPIHVVPIDQKIIETILNTKFLLTWMLIALAREFQPKIRTNWIEIFKEPSLAVLGLQDSSQCKVVFLIKKQKAILIRRSFFTSRFQGQCIEMEWRSALKNQEQICGVNSMLF